MIGVSQSVANFTISTCRDIFWHFAEFYTDTYCQCSSVWNPYYSNDINLLERVQHRFTRLFSELRSLPYEERLRQLGLWSAAIDVFILFSI